MKKIFLLLLVAMLVAALVSCSETKTVTGSKEDDKGVSEEETNTPEENETEKDNESEETTEPESETAAPVVNEFFNDTNNTYDENAVSIKPRHLYWENGTLVAECFVINGYTTKTYNIKVNELMFANANGVIATASFGELSGLVLEPHTYAVWTFKFAPDVISAPNADLSSLIYRSSTNQSVE